MPNTMTTEEIARSQFIHGHTWGRWEYDADAKSIGHTAMRDYWIALDRIDTTEKLGHWCLHMAAKNWITTADLGNLVRAAHDLNGLGG